MALTGNGWMFTSLDASRAYLYSEHAMSWVEAEDFCQMIYGHLATGCQPPCFEVDVIKCVLQMILQNI